jgi:hypothetical protein
VLRIEQPGVCENLVNVSSMGTAFVVLKLSPPMLIKIREVCFVLGIDNMNLVAVLDDKIRNEL